MATHMCAGYFESDGNANVVHSTYIVKPRDIRWISNSAVVVAPLIITQKFIVTNSIATTLCDLRIMPTLLRLKIFNFYFFIQLTLFIDLSSTK